VEIRIAATEAEIRACYPAIHELRPHLAETDFIAQVQRQMQNHGYVLAYIESQGQVAATAGYRVAEYLAWGKVFYLDDLVTQSSALHHGYGGRMMDWLLDRAQALGCKQFHLDSGFQRHDAHRLYLNKHLLITSHHFSRRLV